MLNKCKGIKMGQHGTKEQPLHAPVSLESRLSCGTSEEPWLARDWAGFTKDLLQGVAAGLSPPGALGLRLHRAGCWGDGVSPRCQALGLGFTPSCSAPAPLCCQTAPSFPLREKALCEMDSGRPSDKRQAQGQTKGRNRVEEGLPLGCLDGGGRPGQRRRLLCRAPAPSR